MNILGMGPMELLLIAILALMVFGPQRLPEIMGQVGKAISDFRRATSGLTDEFNRTLQTELAETKATLDSVKQPLQEMQDTLRSPLTSLGATPAAAPYGAPLSPIPEPIVGVDVPAPSAGESAVPAQPAGSETILPPEKAPNGVTTAPAWSWETGNGQATRAAVAPKEPRTHNAKSDDLEPPY